jgi:hypothetical protein
MAIPRKRDASATGDGFRITTQSRRNRSLETIRKQSPLKTQKFKAPEVASIPTFSPRAFTTRQRRSSETKSTSTIASKASKKDALPSSATEKLDTVKVASTPVIPTSESTPLWLLRLYTIRRHTSIMAFLLVAATLIVYGWTVYSQQLWSKSYRRLQNLQRNERQLTTKNEILKNKLAQEAQKPPAKLESPTPQRMIFMNRAPVDSDEIPATTKPTSQMQQSTSNPLAY